MISDTIEKRLQELQEEIMNDEYDLVAGISKESSYESIMKKYEDIADEKKLVDLKKEIEECSNSRQRENSERLYYAVMGHIIDSKTADMEQKLSELSANSVVEYNDSTLHVQDVPTLLRKTNDFSEREVLYNSLIPYKKEYTELNKKTLEIQVPELLRLTNTNSIIECNDVMKKYSHEDVRINMRETYKKLKSIYEEQMEIVSNKKTGRSFRGLSRAHVLYIMYEDSFDGLFSKEKIFPAISSAFLRQSFDLSKIPGLRVDSEFREGKSARASCWPVNPPHDVRVLTKSEGGFDDVMDLMHELGHGLHYSHASPSLSFAEKNLGRTNVFSEVFSFLFENLSIDPLWLEKTFSINKETARIINSRYTFFNLMVFIRYIGILEAELDFFAKGDFSDSDFYTTKLNAYTGLTYDAESYLFDQDDGFYSADYLRAWMNEVTLAEYLKNTFGDLWFENPSASEFLVLLWKEGDRYDVNEVFSRYGLPIDNSDALVRRFTETRYE